MSHTPTASPLLYFTEMCYEGCCDNKENGRRPSPEIRSITIKAKKGTPNLRRYSTNGQSSWDHFSQHFKPHWDAFNKALKQGKGPAVLRRHLEMISRYNMAIQYGVLFADAKECLDAVEAVICAFERGVPKDDALALFNQLRKTYHTLEAAVTKQSSVVSGIPSFTSKGNDSYRGGSSSEAIHEADFDGVMDMSS